MTKGLKYILQGTSFIECSTDYDTVLTGLANLFEDDDLDSSPSALLNISALPLHTSQRGSVLKTGSALTGAVPGEAGRDSSTCTYGAPRFPNPSDGPESDPNPCAIVQPVDTTPPLSSRGSLLTTGSGFIVGSNPIGISSLTPASALIEGSIPSIGFVASPGSGFNGGSCCCTSPFVEVFRVDALSCRVFFGPGLVARGLRGVDGIPSICCLKREKRMRAAWPLVISSWSATTCQSICLGQLRRTR